jgi:hypothetical protein
MREDGYSSISKASTKGSTGVLKVYLPHMIFLSCYQIIPRLLGNFT